MNDPRFFRAYAESHEGEGICFYKVVAEMVTHQLWQFGDAAYWATESGAKSSEYRFTDQPEWLDGSGADDLVQVSEDVFVAAWEAAGGSYESRS
ncbi:MAG: hypothetical protein ABGZ23_16360 [Fuerstiella sp.]